MVTFTGSSLSPQMDRTSLRAAPGTTKEKFLFPTSSNFSRRRASRWPSTLTTVRIASVTSKREPVRMGRPSLVETANRVREIMSVSFSLGRENSF